jgi:predicted naringenin-chalcone synthase
VDAAIAALGSATLEPSRRILREFGNMSSAPVMFVLADLMQLTTQGQHGCAISFGPGMNVEIMHFHAAWNYSNRVIGHSDQN